MADDITLTVRVRDLTRGDLNRVRQQMRGMEGETRRLAGSSNLASERARRLGSELQSVSGRLSQLQRTGRLAGSEMQFMRRTLGLLGRDLRSASRAGELSREEFTALSRQLDDTRLGFDRLTRDVDRHNAVAQRAQRDAQRRQQQAQQMGQLQARAMREEATRVRRMGQLQARALNENARRDAAAQARAQRMGQLQARAMREEEDNVRRLGQLQARAENENRRRDDAERARVQRMGQLQARAMREEATRVRQLQQQQAQAQRAGLSRLAGDAGGNDARLTQRFRGMDDGDVQRMTDRLAALSRVLGGVGGGTDQARRSVGRLTSDLRVMSQVLQDAQREGNLTRRDFNALSNGLRGVDQGARSLRRSGDLTGSSFRTVRRDVAGLRRQLRDMDDGSPLRRLGSSLRAVGSRFSSASRLAKIFMVILVLLGPIAQALGAILMTVLAGSFIALGAYALRGSAQVKTAFGDMKSTIGSVVREAAQPMESALVAAMGNVANAARGMGPTLRQAFEATAPLIDNVFGAITDLAAAALPGMTAALQSAGPAMEGFRQAMGEVGQGLGDMFKKMSVGNEKGLADAWRLMGNELQNLLTNIGEFIANMSKSASASALFIGIMRSFSGILHVVEAAFKAIDSVASPLFQKMNKWVQGTSGLTGASKDLTNSFQYMGLSSAQLKDKLDAVQKKIAEIKSDGKYLAGPAKDMMEEDRGLPGLLEQEKALKLALAGATDKVAAANQNQIKSIKDLIAATQALNEQNRSSLDAQAAQQQAIDDAGKKYKKYAEALKMSNGSIAESLKSQSGREAYDLLSKIASSTNDATKAATEAKRPWDEIKAIWKDGNANLVSLADGMGLTKEQAKSLAAQLINMPSPTIDFQANTTQASSDLQSFINKVQSSPGSKSVTLKTLSARAEAILTNFGYKVQRLPDGSVTVTAVTGTAAGNIEYIRNLLSALNGTIARTYVETINTTIYQTDNRGKSLHEVVGATGGMASSLRKFAGGGSISGGVLDGPGTKTSDSLMARLSRGEFVMRAAAVDKYGPHFMQMVNNGLYEKPPGFAKGGKVSQATKDARNDLRGSFGISMFGRYAGYQRTPFERSLAVPDNINGLVSNLNKTMSDIRKAFSGRTESSLVRQLTSSGKALIRQQKSLEKVNASLEKAKTKLDDLKSAASQLKESVTSGVLSATNVTQIASGDNNVTMRDVMAQMRTGVDKSTAFSSALTQLKSKGVSKDIIGQIAEAGISGGGLETAGAILSASSSEIQTLNDMQARITASAKSAGATAADAMYAAGIKAADGLVKGLQKKQDAIEAAMLKIAKSMEKAIKRALGIKSPSKVMEKVGHFTAEGFAVGMEKNRSVGSAWTSMLTTSSPASGASGAPGGGGVYTIPIYVGGKFLDEIILDTNRRIVRTRGGDVQKVFGR